MSDRILKITWSVYSNIAEDATGENFPPEFRGKTLCTNFQDEIEARIFFETRLKAMRNSGGKVSHVWLEAGVVYKHQTIKAVS